jgi:hypothetical protein
LPNNNQFQVVAYMQHFKPEIMKLSTFYSAFLLVIVITILPGCEVIGGIFKAGVWTGVLLIALVFAIIIFIISKLGSKK